MTTDPLYEDEQSPDVPFFVLVSLPFDLLRDAWDRLRTKPVQQPLPFGMQRGSDLDTFVTQEGALHLFLRAAAIAACAVIVLLALVGAGALGRAGGLW